MKIWDDIEAAKQTMPEGLFTVEDTLRAVSLGLVLSPIIFTKGTAATREFLVKTAATLVHAIEIVDAEIEAEADEAQDADDAEYAKCPF